MFDFLESVIQLLRPKHWVKNILVFLPALFSGGIENGDTLFASFVQFAAFCCAASAVYIFNDLHDIERDRANPTKMNRPLASGKVSKKDAWVIAALLVIVIVALELIWGGVVPASIIAVYVVMNIAYSAGLKHIPIIDVCILAAGYILRVYCGALACDIHVSSWLYLTILSASFYMGLGKRRGEFTSNGKGSRPVLERYGLEFLEKNMYMFLALANVFYALWARDSVSGMLATVPIVMVLSMRYSLDIERSSDGDPMEVISSDRWLILLVALLVIVTSIVIYGPLQF